MIPLLHSTVLPSLPGVQVSEDSVAFLICGSLSIVHCYLVSSPHFHLSLKSGFLFVASDREACIQVIGDATGTLTVTRERSFGDITNAPIISPRRRPGRSGNA